MLDNIFVNRFTGPRNQPFLLDTFWYQTAGG